MSGRILADMGKCRHRFSDDVESLLHVIFYCCIRWIPHDEIKYLSSVISRFFYHSYTINGVMIGGDCKLVERSIRNFSRKFNFPCTAVGEWITRMFALLPPLPPGNVADWNEGSIEELWQDMIGRDLPDGDRVEHDVEDTRRDLPRPYCATRTLRMLSSKRKREDDETDVTDLYSKRQCPDSSESDGSVSP